MVTCYDNIAFRVFELDQSLLCTSLQEHLDRLVSRLFYIDFAGILT